MKLKDVLRKNFWNEETLILKRFKSAKFFFAIAGIIFFMNYFLVANFPKNDLFIKFLPSLYVVFIISSILLTYFSIKKKFLWKINNSLFIVLLIILIIIWIIFALPFLIDNKILENLK